MQLSFEEKVNKIKDLRPIDDICFEYLASDKYVCEEMLRTLMGDPYLIVETVTPQYNELNLLGRSVRLDAFCILSDNRRVNIEVQRADNDNHFKRVRYNASCITVNESNTGDRFENVIELYIIYISEKDFIKGGKTIYHTEKRLQETDKYIDDGLHEIYVNTEVDDGSDIAELMSDFLKKEIKNPKFPILSKRFSDMKETEGGASAMCEVMEREIKKDRKRLIKDMLMRGKTEQQIVEFCNFPAELIQEVEKELSTKKVAVV